MPDPTPTANSAVTSRGLAVPDPALVELVAEGIARVWGYKSLAEVDRIDDGESERVRESAVGALSALAAAGWLRERDELQPGVPVAITLDAFFRGGTPRRMEGTVIRVADDGMVTGSFPQDGPLPLEITAVARQFARIHRLPAPNTGAVESTEGQP